MNWTYKNPFTETKFTVSNQLNLRGKKICYDNGVRIKNRPQKKIETCFEIETINFQVIN